jgi:hypothetical protein
MLHEAKLGQRRKPQWILKATLRRESACGDLTPFSPAKLKIESHYAAKLRTKERQLAG